MVDGRDKTTPVPSSEEATRRDRRSSPALASANHVPAFAANDALAGRYRIVRFIAVGGMGEVYEARDIELRERIALKTIRPEIANDTAALERFKREIQLARQVTHPNVSRIFDLGKHVLADGSELTFFTMELVDGESLADRIGRSGRMSQREALPIVRQIVEGVAAAHAKGIVHRDLKPSNVMMDTGDGAPRIVVTDFGIAYRGSDEAASELYTGQSGDRMVGSPAYMAPEQIEGKTVTPRTDIYSLGVILYELASGERPFDGEATNVIATKLSKQAPTLSARIPDVDPRWDAVVARCMAREPGDRYASVGDVYVALAGAPRSSRPLAFAAGGFVLAAAVAGGLALATRSSHDPAVAVAPASSTGRAEVAILGFKNLTGKPESDWLSTAITEMLRTELAAGDRVHLVPGEVVARAKLELSLADELSHSRDTLAKIRTSLGSDYVIAGSYITLDDKQLRLDVRLEDTRRGEIIASLSETGSEGKLFELVAATGAQLRERLGAPVLSPSQATTVRASLPTNPTAARLYAEGLAHARRADALGARDLLLKAVAIEPDHPLIQAALAAVWLTLGYEARAREAAEKAHDHTAQLSTVEQRTIDAVYHETRHEWDAAIRIYEALSREHPDDVDRGLRLATTQISASRSKESLETIAALKALAPPASTDPRIDLLEAYIANRTGDYVHVLAASKAALAHAGERNARKLVPEAHTNQAIAHWRLGRIPEAFAELQLAAHAAEEVDDDYQRARVIGLEAAIDGDLGKMADARRLNEQALALHKKIGNQTGAARALNNMAVDMGDQDDLEGAQSHFSEALLIAHEVGDREQQTLLELNLGDLAHHRGELAEAQRLEQGALAAARQTDHRQWAATGLTNLGDTALDSGRLAEAKQSYGEALVTDKELGRKDEIAKTERGLGQISFAADDVAAAKQHLQTAAALQTELGQQLELGITQAWLAELLIEAGDTKAALALLDATVTSLGDVAVANLARAFRALAYARDQRTADAIAELERDAKPSARVWLRFATELATARAHFAVGHTRVADAALVKLRAEADKLGYAGYVLEADLWLAKLRGTSTDALETRAKQLGFLRIARLAR